MPRPGHRAPGRAFLILSVLFLIVSGLGQAPGVARAQGAPLDTLVYQELPRRRSGEVSLGAPILSEDGTYAFYAESAPEGLNPNRPARIFGINTVSGLGIEVDSYAPLCHCMSWVDVSDEEHAVSTDTVQIRRAARVGTGRDPLLLKLDSNEISGFKIAGNGSEVFFTLIRDSTMDGGKTRLPRGVYAIPFLGGTPRQIVGPEGIARALNVPIAQLPVVLHFDHNPHVLDVTTEGEVVTFAAAAGQGREYVLTVPGGGGTPQVIAGPYPFGTHAAISGDGATLAWGMTRDQSYDAGVRRAGKSTELLGIYNETYQPLQLSKDGKFLLVGTDGSLYDTDTLLGRPLATPPIESGSALLTGGVDRASMSRDGKMILYVQPASDVFGREQLATIAVGAESVGERLRILDASVNPDRITTDAASSPQAVPTVYLNWEGYMIGVGVSAIYLGEADPNIRGGEELRDTQGPDPRRGQGIFSSEGLWYSQSVARGDDSGPRILRAYAEVEIADGRRIAVAVDFGTLEVIAP